MLTAPERLIQCRFTECTGHNGNRCVIGSQHAGGAVLTAVVVNKAKMRHDFMVRFADRDRSRSYVLQFPSVLFSMLGSTIPVSIIGARFAMSVEPFWTPERYGKHHLPWNRRSS
jgi:hypothetical protein